MNNDTSYTTFQILYARYLKSGMILEDFCKKHQVPYWDFSIWINKWEDRYGKRMVEESTVTHFQGNGRMFPATTIQPTAQRLFPLEFEKNNVPLRVPNEAPPFRVNLELLEPGSILKGAKIVLPSGVTLKIPEISIKGLILMAILYEGNCTRTE